MSYPPGSSYGQGTGRAPPPPPGPPPPPLDHLGGDHPSGHGYPPTNVPGSHVPYNPLASAPMPYNANPLPPLPVGMSIAPPPQPWRQQRQFAAPHIYQDSGRPYNGGRGGGRGGYRGGGGGGGGGDRQSYDPRYRDRDWDRERDWDRDRRSYGDREGDRDRWGNGRGRPGRRDSYRSSERYGESTSEDAQSTKESTQDGDTNAIAIPDDSNAMIEKEHGSAATSEGEKVEGNADGVDTRGADRSGNTLTPGEGKGSEDGGSASSEKGEDATPMDVESGEQGEGGVKPSDSHIEGQSVVKQEETKREEEKVEETKKEETKEGEKDREGEPRGTGEDGVPTDEKSNREGEQGKEGERESERGRGRYHEGHRDRDWQREGDRRPWDPRFDRGGRDWDRDRDYREGERGYQPRGGSRPPRERGEWGGPRGDYDRERGGGGGGGRYDRYSSGGYHDRDRGRYAPMDDGYAGRGPPPPPQGPPPHFGQYGRGPPPPPHDHYAPHPHAHPHPGMSHPPAGGPPMLPQGHRPPGHMGPMMPLGHPMAAQPLGNPLGHPPGPGALPAVLASVVNRAMVSIMNYVPSAAQLSQGLALPAPPTLKFTAPLPLQLAEEERMARKGPLWEVSQVKVFKYSHWLPIVDAFEGRRKEGLSLMTVGDLIDLATRRRITEQGVVYALIRLGKTMPAISVLLNQYLDKIPADRLDTVINSPLPARDSWLIHRACWEGNVDVVRAIVNRGAITNRLNEYNEHPAEVLVQGVAQNGVSQASKEKILEILVNTLLRGAKDETLQVIRSATDAENASKGKLVWLEKILAEEDAKRRKARAAKKAGGATVSGATAASVGGVSVGTATSATGETVDQTHVWITGVPFEYPMESIKEWFSHAGTILNFHSLTGGSKNFFFGVKIAKVETELHNGKAIIQFNSPEAAARALKYDGSQLMDRIIHVTLRRPTAMMMRKYRQELEQLRRKAAGLVATDDKDKSFAELREELMKRRKAMEEKRLLKKEKAKRKKEKKEEAMGDGEDEEKGEEAGKEGIGKRSKKMKKKEEAEGTQEEGESDANDDPALIALKLVRVPAWVKAGLKPGPDQKHVFVSGIPYEIPINSVRDEFATVGDLVDIYMPLRRLRSTSRIDAVLMRQTGAVIGHKGTAILLFNTPDDVRKALAMDGGTMDGHTIRVTRRKEDRKEDRTVLVAKEEELQRQKERRDERAKRRAARQLARTGFNEAKAKEHEDTLAMARGGPLVGTKRKRATDASIETGTEPQAKRSKGLNGESLSGSSTVLVQKNTRSGAPGTIGGFPGVVNLSSQQARPRVKPSADLEEGEVVLDEDD